VAIAIPLHSEFDDKAVGWVFKTEYDEHQKPK